MFEEGVTEDFINKIKINLEDELIDEITNLAIQDYHKYHDIFDIDEKNLNLRIELFNKTIFNLNLYYEVNEKTILDVLGECEKKKKKKNKKIQEVINFLLEIRRFNFHINFLINQLNS